MENETNTQSPKNVAINSLEEGKTIALIAYLTIVGLIIAFVMNNEKKKFLCFLPYSPITRFRRYWFSAIHYKYNSDFRVDNINFREYFINCVMGNWINGRNKRTGKTSTNFGRKISGMV